MTCSWISGHLKRTCSPAPRASQRWSRRRRKNATLYVSADSCLSPVLSCVLPFLLSTVIVKEDLDSPKSKYWKVPNSPVTNTKTISDLVGQTHKMIRNTMVNQLRLLSTNYPIPVKRSTLPAKHYLWEQWQGDSHSFFRCCYSILRSTTFEDNIQERLGAKAGYWMSTLSESFWTHKNIPSQSFLVTSC